MVSLFSIYLNKGSDELLVGRGYSMSLDNVCTYSMNIVREVEDKDEIVVGNIYSYRNEEGGSTSHRLKGIEYDRELGENLYYFQGDNPITNKRMDKPVTLSQIKYIYIKVLRQGVNDKDINSCYKDEFNTGNKVLFALNPFNIVWGGSLL